MPVLLSAYTKDRGELLTGGGEAGLAQQLDVKADLLSPFPSSPATVALNNNLPSLRGDILCA